jgi:DNA-binding GntR family transcriptional regulator
LNFPATEKEVKIAVDSKSLTAVETVYRSIRERIINGLYLHGSKLRVEPLAREMKVSGSTVREALTRLSSDRLVMIEGRKGFRVMPMSLDDLRDITRVRMTLECAALHESIAVGGDDWEVQLVSAYHRLTLAEERLLQRPDESFSHWEDASKLFHDALGAGASSEWLRHFGDILFHQSERYRRSSSCVPSSREDVREEHKRIFDATINRNSEEALDALRNHIERSQKVLQKSLKNDLSA